MEDPDYQKKIKIKYIGTRKKHKAEDLDFQKKIDAKTRATKNKKRQIDPDYDKKILEKTMATNMKNLGVPFPLQSPIVRDKANRKYKYDGRMFDSAPEIAYYIWLTDHNIEFVFHPTTYLPYFNTKRNMISYYEPDFLIVKTNQLEDIKGDHLFKPSFYNKNPDKWKCIKANNVRLIRQTEYEKYMNYCKDKFGNKCWYLQFKTIGIEKSKQLEKIRKSK